MTAKIRSVRRKPTGWGTRWKFMATDEDGTVRLHQEKPIQMAHCWASFCETLTINRDQAWKQSLRRIVAPRGKKGAGNG